jgi:FMN reductase
MSKTPVLVGLGGSLRRRSYSAAAVLAALRIAESLGASVESLDVRELALPVYDPELDLGGYAEAYRPGIERVLAASRRADAMIWSSPTYHGTITGVVKNAIDFLEFLSEDRPPYLQGKAVGLITINDPSTFGAMIGSVHELRAWLAPTRVVVSRGDFAEDLSIGDSAVRRMRRLVEELLEFATARGERT